MIIIQLPCECREGDEHLAALKKHDSVLWKHKENEHKNKVMRISMRSTKRFKDPHSRQGNEAVRIFHIDIVARLESFRAIKS